MNRGPDVVHPSPLALEQLLAGQGSAETTSHLLACEACRLHLSAMEASARKFSASPKSLRAREAATGADRRWKRRAASFTVFTAAAIALITFGAPMLITRPTPVDQPTSPILATKTTPSAQRRQGREVLEPRPETWPSRLRKVPLRGRDVEFGQGALEAAAPDGVTRPFTLTHTKVDITVTGFMQAVTVTQRFQNPFSSPVEAVYVFPLPDDSAVHAMELHAGTRIIKADIQRRATARANYEQAKAEGRRAALLDQERPNIFTQSIANLLPGETVEVTLQYIAPLAFDDGVYTLNFPMVVGPRYIPGATLPGESQGTGTARDTDQVLDASRISPPTARSGRDIEVHVRVDAGSVIEDVWTVSHRLEIDRSSTAQLELELNPLDTLPNKDLIVRWRVSGPQARASMLAAGGAFALMLNPEQMKDGSAVVTPKEMVFVIDTSCSMNGAPLNSAKLAMEKALTQMSPRDTFMLIDFAERASSFHEVPLLATPESVERAVNYLRSLPSRGGTNQLAGIRRALDRAEDPSRVRMVLLMTDGFIGNEDEIIAETHRLRGNARVFGFGIGSSVNHYLLSRLSTEGRGFYQYVRPDEDSTEAVNRFVRRVKRPLITDISIDWGGLPVADVMPEPVVDLFDAQPLIIQGRYRTAASGTVVLRGRRGTSPVTFEVPVTLPDLKTDGRALTMAWARRRIEKLSSAQYATTKPEIIEQITSLGLEFHLVTPYTSLVAIEERPVTNVPAITLTEPTLTPDQTSAPTTPQLAKQTGSLGVKGTQNGFFAPMPDVGGLQLGLRGKGGGGGGIAPGPRGGGVIGGLSGAEDNVGHGKIGGQNQPVTGKTGTVTDPGDNFDMVFGYSAPPANGTTTKPTGRTARYIPTEIATPEPVAAMDPPAPPPRPNTVSPPPKKDPPSGLREGTLTNSEVMEVIFGHKQAILACSARHAAGTTGRLVLSWRVLASGSVTDVKIDTNAPGGDQVAICLSAVIRQAHFPAHVNEGARIRFPFKF